MTFKFKALVAAIALTVAAPLWAQDGKVKVQWLGQAAFKITTVLGKVIVIDPWLTSNPKTPEACRKLEALGKVDLVLVTHGHFDHIADAPALAKMNDAPLWAPAGLSQSLAILAVLPPSQALRMDKSGTVTPVGPNVKVTMVRAEHSSELVWNNQPPAKTKCTWAVKPAASSSNLRTASRSGTWVTPASLATCA